MCPVRPHLRLLPDRRRSVEGVGGPGGVVRPFVGDGLRLLGNGADLVNVQEDPIACAVGDDDGVTVALEMVGAREDQDTGRQQFVIQFGQFLRVYHPPCLPQRGSASF